MERAFKGVWIPKEVWLSKDLSLQEKVFLAEIDSLDNDKGCYASNKYFADFFGLSRGRCSQVISGLEKKGIIKIQLIYGDNGNVEKRIIRVVSKLNTPIKYPKGGIKDIKDPYLGNEQENNTSANNTLNIKTKEDERDPVVELLIKNKIVHENGIPYTLLDDLNDITDNFNFDNPDEMIIEAIKDATRGNGKTWKFVYNKLNLWFKFGIKNKADLERHKEVEQSEGSRRGNAGNQGAGTSYEQALQEVERARKSFNR